MARIGPQRHPPPKKSFVQSYVTPNVYDVMQWFPRVQNISQNGTVI